MGLLRFVIEGEARDGERRRIAGRSPATLSALATQPPVPPENQEHQTQTPMAAPLLDLILLRTCLAVVDHQGFKEGARALGLSQPAVSQQISRLEASLGREVFGRVDNRREPLLTSFGSRLVIEARALLKVNIEAHQRLLQQVRFITIGVTPMSADFVSAHALQQISQQLGSGTRLRVENYSSTLLDLIHRNELDIAFVLNFDSTDTASNVGHIEYGWYSAPERTLIGDHPPVITFGDERCRVTQLGLQKLREAGLHPRIVFHAEGIEAACTSARAGMGMILLNSMYARGGLMERGSIPTIDPVPVKLCARSPLELDLPALFGAAQRRP